MTDQPHAQIAHSGASAGEPHGRQWRGPGLRTGTLLFLILSVALAPIGIIGISAALTQLQRSDAERQALLAASTREQAQNLSSRLRSDRILLIGTVQRRGDVPSGERCRTILGLFPGVDGEAPITQIVDPATGAHRCIDGVPPDRDAIGRLENGRRISPANGTLTQTVLRLDDGSNVEIVYPVAVLRQILGQSSAIEASRRYIDRADDSLSLADGQSAGWDAFGLTSNASIGRSSLTLRALTSRTLFDSADAALTLATPVGMWLLALLLSWLVVDRLLLTPVARLGRQLGDYTPGDRMPDERRGWFQVAEVSSLAALMRGLVGRVADDKHSLAQSLEHQQNLTREVHHRVKNNLQIIASLINLHSRDSADEMAIGAYRTMQRRVDALAVVYRHLQAEGEAQPGVAANTLLTDLSNGLKQGLAADGSSATVHIDTVPVRVKQDIALPMAFFVTELAELAHVRNPGTTVTISLTLEPDNPLRARLAVTSEALKGSSVFAESRASYHRVLQGLSRQLREPLAIDERGGRYAIVVPTL